MKYADVWREYVTRHFDHDDKTLDPGFMESVIWSFKQLYDKGLAYEGYRVVMTRCSVLIRPPGRAALRFTARSSSGSERGARKATSSTVRGGGSLQRGRRLRARADQHRAAAGRRTAGDGR